MQTHHACCQPIVSTECVNGDGSADIEGSEMGCQTSVDSVQRDLYEQQPDKLGRSDLADYGAKTAKHQTLNACPESTAGTSVL